MVSRPRDTAPTYRDLPFYLHAFGLATMYDASKKTPLEQIGLELKALRRNQAAYFADGIAEFRMGSYLLEIDTKRGYWPIHQSTLRTRPSRIEGGRPTMVADESCDLELVKVNDTWVPAKAKLQAQGRSQTFEFTWKTVNETVDPEEIDIEKVVEELTESYQRDKERYEASKQRDGVPK